MTLYRQLFIFIFLLFFIFSAGTWYAKINSTRTFLTDQLASHSQDTATSLGLSVSQYALKRDMAVVESMINAVFDRGRYKTIRLTDSKGNVLYERVLDVTIEDVPQWFIHLFTLEAPDTTTNVMAGWNQVGSIYVKSHPGFAYKTLWKDVVSTTLLFTICSILVLFAVGLGLHILLKSLFFVERQADAICRKEYEIQERIPWTKELRRVVEAMNRMTNKIKEIFEEHITQAEEFRVRAYHDPLTGLGNRRYFDTQCAARLDHGDSITKGVMILVTLNDLQILNHEKGFEAGDNLLKRVAVLLQDVSNNYDSCVVARLVGGSFGILLPDALLCDAETITSGLANQIHQLSTEKITASDNVAYMGTVAYTSTTTLNHLLSEADTALAAAKQMGPNGWNVRSINEGTYAMPAGKQQWMNMLDDVLKERRISLYAQKVVKITDWNHILHCEILSRIIQEDGKPLGARLFIPPAERLNIMPLIDRATLEEVMQLDTEKLPVKNIAVNISHASLKDHSFRQWLQSALKGLPDSAPRIIFEFTELCALHNSDLAKKFRDMVHGFGHAICLDHYGQVLSNLGYIKTLRPDYIKIDRAYTRELKDKESDSRFFIDSLCSIARNIDISVVANGVETEQQVQILTELNLYGLQGYIVEKPRPLKEIIQK